MCKIVCKMTRKMVNPTNKSIVRRENKDLNDLHFIFSEKGAFFSFCRSFFLRESDKLILLSKLIELN